MAGASKPYTEGSARIVEGGGVFLNPAMRGLRDISVAFLKCVASPGYSLLDSTAATGIRGIRYAKEAGAGSIVALDVNPKAARNAKKNFTSNKVTGRVVGKDLQLFAVEASDKFDVVDLDPFGSPAPYINDVLKVSKDGSLLMVTATDTAVLCGAHASACVKQYGAVPIHNHLCKEAGLRILVGHVVRKAAEFNMGVEPMVSVADMHYMRIFVRLHKGASEAYSSMKSLGFGKYCNACSWAGTSAGIIPKASYKCAECGKETQQFGPIFTKQLNDRKITEQMLKAGIGEAHSERTMLSLNAEPELPFFISMPLITRKLGMSSVPYSPVIEKLREKGYAAGRTIFHEDGIKTDAPVSAVVSIVKKLRGV